MPTSRKQKTAIELPRGVHRVMGRNRMPYYYFQPGRGTAQAARPHPSAERYALRGILERVAAGAGSAEHRRPRTARSAPPASNSLPTAMVAWRTTISRRRQGTSTRRRSTWRSQSWGDLPLAGLRRKHVQALIDKLSPGTARNFVNCLSVVLPSGRASAGTPKSTSRKTSTCRKPGRATCRGPTNSVRSRQQQIHRRDPARLHALPAHRLARQRRRAAGADLRRHHRWPRRLCDDDPEAQARRLVSDAAAACGGNEDVGRSAPARTC